MSYITDIFDRLDLQQIREFLLHGVDCVQVSEESYKQRLENAKAPIFEMIEKNFSSEEEVDKISSYIHQYAGINQNVYMEIGMQCGAALVANLLTIPQNE